MVEVRSSVHEGTGEPVPVFTVFEVMRILGKSSLTMDNIHDLLKPLRQKAEEADDRQLHIDFKFD